MSFQIPPYVKANMKQIQLFHPNRPIGFPRRVLHLIHMASGSTFTNHLTSSNHVPPRGCFVEHEGLPIQLLRLGADDAGGWDPLGSTGPTRIGPPQWLRRRGSHQWNPPWICWCDDLRVKLFWGAPRAPCRNPRFFHMGTSRFSLKWKRLDLFRLYQLLTHPNRQSSMHLLPTNMFFWEFKVFGEFKATPRKKKTNYGFVALGWPTNSPICPTIGPKIHCQPNKLYHVISIISMLFTIRSIR